MNATIQDIRNLLASAESDLDGTIQRMADAKQERAAEQIALHEFNPTKYCIHGKDLEGSWWSSRGNLCALCDRGFKNDRREHEYFAEKAVTGAVFDGQRYLKALEDQEAGRPLDYIAQLLIARGHTGMLDSMTRRLIPGA